MKIAKRIILISLLLLLLVGTLLLDPLVRFTVDLHLKRFSQAGAVYAARIDGSETRRSEALHWLKAYLERQLAQYYAKTLPYDRLMGTLSALSDTDLPQEDIDSCRQAAEEMELARGYFARADACYQSGNYKEAIPLYRKALIAEDYAAYRLEQAQTLYKNSILEQAEAYMTSARYDAAQNVLLEGQDLLGADKDLSAALEDARLFEAGATPDDRCPATGLKTDRVLPHFRHRIPYQRQQPIDRVRDMARHELKRSRDIPSEPGHHLPVFIPHHRELPEIVRDKQRDHKNNHVHIGFQPLTAHR